MTNFKEKILKIAACKIWLLETFALPLVLLGIRFYVGMAIWNSGWAKYTGIDGTKTLFESEFIPNWQANHVKHWLGLDIPFPVPSPTFGVYSSMSAELCFSALLMLGLAGRAAALGIIGLLSAIKLFVYPDAPEIPPQLLLLAVIVAAGPGRISADWLIRRKLLPAISRDSLAA